MAALRGPAHTCVLLCAALLLFRWLFGFSTNHGTKYMDSNTPPVAGPHLPEPSEQEMAATVKICDALRELRALAPRTGAAQSAAKTPFEFLGLDPGVPPFTPWLSSGSLGPQVQSDVEKMVNNAALKVRESLWPQWLHHGDDGGSSSSHSAAAASIRQHVTATYVVSAMLVDEHARLMYLGKVHPKLKKWDESVKVVDSLCGKLRETTWKF